MTKIPNWALNFLVTTTRDLARLCADTRGNVAIMMGLLMVPMVGAMGLGFEVSHWYMSKRAMQNAADAAVIAAASNASSNYDVEGKAVAALYGFVDGQHNVTVTASNTATCPAGGNTCYSVTITGLDPLYLSQVVGYNGNITANGARQTTLSSSAIALQATVQWPLCLLALNTTGTALRTNGAPKTNFAGCSVMSDSDATCNGSNLNADAGMAAGSNGGGAGCGKKQYSNVPVVPDPYAGLAANIPKNTCGSYPQEPGKHGSPLPASNLWTGSKSLGSGTTQICGDMQLTGDVTINTTNLSGAVLVIENGQLDLNGHTLSTSNGSALTIIFSGDDKGSYTHAPTGSGTLDVQAPTSGPWSGVALYQDPSLTKGIDVSYAGNNPTWDLTGLVYMPNASTTFSGAINKSANGAACLVMITGSVLINGTGSIYATSPAGCKDAGLIMPTATIPGRAQLVY
jgi:Flp pilus assembly protein TadG